MVNHTDILRSPVIQRAEELRRLLAGSPPKQLVLGLLHDGAGWMEQRGCGRTVD